MFAPSDYFKTIPCPELDSCSLLECIFAHQSQQSGTAGLASTVASRGISDSAPKVSQSDDGPPTKKRRLASDVGDEDARSGPSKNVKTTATVVPRTLGSSESVVTKPTASVTGQPNPAQRKGLQSIDRPISPPPPSKRDSSLQKSAQKSSPSNSIQDGIKQVNGTAKSATTNGFASPRPRLPKEGLNPRMLTKAPAPHATRLTILKKLHEEMAKQNARIAKDSAKYPDALVLTPDELIVMALDEEEKIANSKPLIYTNVIKLRIVKIMKLTSEEWKQVVLEDFANRHFLEDKSAPMQNDSKPFKSDLTREQELAVLPRLRTPLDGLDGHGYVTSPPTDAEIATAKAGVEASDGWEKCDRCDIRFQVFPGRRNEDGLLTSGGACTYHPAKIFRPPKKKTDALTGSAEPYYMCCSQSISASSGCTTCQHHVFNVKDPKRLASIWQFKETPAQPEKGKLPPVTFDCEMGYTTKGLELIRLTAATWPEGRPLIDVLVRPHGEILDFNSRFSGVWPEQFLTAAKYTGDAEPKGVASTSGDPTAKPTLQILRSPEAARTLLFSHLQPSTPLIGHAIDNDLNTTRIIHPTIVDTVLLYPHPRGLPIRFGLKMLTLKHLDRKIQIGDGGHDSLEDAVATGDLVRVKCVEKWRVLAKEGWVVGKKGELVMKGEVEEDEE